jgi:DNA helicase-2/ATP-dependent DNA helicase PcrA
MSGILAELNEKQKEAVLTTKGPVLILAGAGSGKTKALTHRIAYLIKEKKVVPYSILAVTFTNKAAKEMTERVVTLLGKNYTAPKVFNRSFLTNFPAMGTFHSICARILREDGHYLGYKRSFTIYDESDSLSAIKQVLKQLQIEDRKAAPQGVKAYISGAKNELLTPRKYAHLASGYFQELAAKVYPEYQKYLFGNNALDFDDLLFETVKLFQKFPEVLEKYQNLWQYIHIDEYQDTNHAQYIFVKLLASKNRNLCVVGDDWQCIVEGSQVQTSEGLKRIEDIEQNDLVLAASGYGETKLFKVMKKKKFDFEGDLLEIGTTSGKKISSTSNHILFARIECKDCYFVYLMYSKEKGYRVGMTKGTRFDGKKDDIGLRVRANQERAARMWILKICESKEQATFYESLYSCKYGLPMLVFHAFKNRSMSFGQELIDRLYEEIDTKKRAEKLMVDLEINFDYPHFVPQATVRNGRETINVNAVLFGDRRVTARSPWSASRLSVESSSDSAIRCFQKMNFNLRSGKKGTSKIEIHNLNYGMIESLIEAIKEEKNENININRYSFLTDKKFLFLPASQVHPGMSLAILSSSGKEIMQETVSSIEKKPYKGPVYDLDIDKVHNYTAGGIVVHNSIYSWRGADFQNILDFEHDYPEAKIVKLEQNYRNTKAIIDAAHHVIAKNENRSEKELWTKNKAGLPIVIAEIYNEQEEARFIIQESGRLVREDKLRLNDIVVLYRTNAQSRAVETELIRFNLPYRIVGGVRFYERKEIKDILAYLRVINSDDDWVAFERAINVPPRGIGVVSVKKIIDFSRKHKLSISQTLENLSEINLAPKISQNLKDLTRKLEIFRQAKDKASLHELIDLVLRKSDYLNYLDDGTLNGEERLENVKELLSVAEDYTNVHGDETNLEGFLEEIALIADIDNWDPGEEALTLMTLHSAKGLEFKTVFIIGMEENLFPHSNSFFDPEQLEEERRLCYVGLTRAKERVYLTLAERRMIYGGVRSNSPSRFLADIPENLVTSYQTITFKKSGSDDFVGVPTESVGTTKFNSYFKIGDKVIHEEFGEGKIIDMDDDDLKIDFGEKTGRKWLSLTYAALKKKA